MKIYRAATGAIERVPLEGPASLAELQRAVGGYIEAIPGARIGRAFCNEDGRNLGASLQSDRLDSFPPGSRRRCGRA